MYTITDLKSELAGQLHGTSLNKVEGIDGLIYRAARKLINDFDPIETIRIAQLATPLFDRVYDYTCPSDLKGDRIVDIRPQVNRSVQDRFFQTYNEAFDMSKAALSAGGEFSVQYNTAVKSIRIAKNLVAGLLVNGCDSLTANGTWVVGGDATNLTLDTLNYVYGGASLNFDVTGAGTTAYLENTTQSAIDLSRDEDQGYEFVYAFIPDGTTVTSFSLRWGSSSANYWSSTVTANQDSTAFQTGWNLLAFPWSSATETGTPDAEAVDYVRFTVTYDGDAATHLRLNSIVSQLGTIYEIEYYSKFLFRDGTTGAFKETVTDDSDIVNLDTDSYNLLLNLVAYFCAQQIQGSNAGFDANFFKNEYETERKRYVAKIRSQIIKPQSVYYKMPTNHVTRIRNW